MAPPDEALLFIIAVCWPDLGTGVRPGLRAKPPGLRLLASKNDTRAWPGGFGYAKVGVRFTSHHSCEESLCRWINARSTCAYVKSCYRQTTDHPSSPTKKARSVATTRFSGSWAKIQKSPKQVPPTFS